MLAGIQQRPSLPRRGPRENAHKRRVAPHTGVMLFRSYMRILRRTRTVEGKVPMRRLSARFAVEVSAPCAGLNPKVHSSVADACEQSQGARQNISRFPPFHLLSKRLSAQ
jgi:hypothetical protein